MSEEEAGRKLYFGYVGADGIEWNTTSPIDGPFELASDNEPSLWRSLVEPFQGTLQLRLRVDWGTFKWLRKLIGLKRYDYIWAYREWRKGHPRCRR